MSGGLVFFGVVATAFLAFLLFGSLAPDTYPPPRSPSPEAPLWQQERKNVLQFSKELYPLVQEALAQIDRFNILNDSSMVTPNIAEWRRLASDAASLKTRIESLSNVLPDLQIALGHLRNWSQANEATLRDSLLYVQTGRESYRLSANQRIAEGNSAWTAFADTFDAAMEKYGIRLSDLK